MGLLDTILLIRLRLSKIPDGIGTGRLGQAERQHSGQDVLVKEVARQDERLGVFRPEGFESLDGLLQREDDGGRVHVQARVEAIQVEVRKRVCRVAPREESCVVHHNAWRSAELRLHGLEGRRHGLWLGEVDCHV